VSEELTHGSDPFEHHGGAYVLGALSEREAAEFSAHLDTCAACARSVAEIAHLPALLDRLPAADVARLAEHLPGEDPSVPAGDLEPPPTLLPDLLTRAGVVARPRRWRLAAAVTAVAVAASVAGGLVVEVGSRVLAPRARPPAAAAPSSPGTSAATSPATGQQSGESVRPVVLRPVGDQPVTAAVRLQPVAWGTRIELTCAYGTTAARYPPGSSFSLTVTDPFGNRQQVATWVPLTSRTLTIPAATSLRRSGISQVDVRMSDQVVLTARLL
jgi:putative zinc finger protein